MGDPIEKNPILHMEPEVWESWLRSMGEDPEREGIRASKNRWAAAMGDLLSGYRTEDPLSVLVWFDSDDGRNVEVTVDDIEVWSLCEHHLLPFFGTCSISYLPRGRVVGLSKLPRMVDVLSRRLNIQESLTNRIAETLGRWTDGVKVTMTCTHLCMAARGVSQMGAKMTTVARTGFYQGEDE